MRLFIFGLLLFSIPVSAQKRTTISGSVKEATNRQPIPVANIVVLNDTDSTFVSGTISLENGAFSIPGIPTGNYFLKITHTGYNIKWEKLVVGQLSNFLDIGSVELQADSLSLSTVMVVGKQVAISPKMDKKTFSLLDNISQAGGSALDAMKNLPGITTQDGKVQLRGNDKVMILIDGKQTALTGFVGQGSLENIPASAIEKIEIINNPSSRYDANGNAGIINLIYKKEKKEGFNAKAGLVAGAGALWIKKENYPDIRPQYGVTPKINTSISLNYRKNKVNLFFQGDNLYSQTLNKNEFADRYYDNGDIIRQQTKRNRNTNFLTLKTGADWFINSNNTLTLSGLFGSEKIIDHGDEPFFNEDLKERKRLWQFLEDELKTTAMATIAWQHKFTQPGRSINAGFNYTYHRENEKYFFTNILPAYTGLDSFKLISDEHVSDFNLDYVQPLKYGRFETGIKFRRRFIPVNMQFKPGIYSPLDTSAGGQADYSETIPAVYGNYIFENNNFEIEAGIRVEYVHVEYDVNPNHPVYMSDRYHYFQPFPNVRLAYKINDHNRLSVFYNRRVDRPNEVDIRIFPKYDDAEIIKVGNPALRPQFTDSYELGYKTEWGGGYLFPSVYYKRMDGTITRIGSIVPGSNLIYNIFQNAGKSYNTGLDLMISQEFSKAVSVNLNLNGYKNIIDAFTVVNKYPVENTYTAAKDNIFSGNIKLNGLFHLCSKWDAQISAIYQAPDLIPQGKTFSRFSIDLGVKKIIQEGKGEIFANATDVANTLRVKKEIRGNGFRYVSTDYYETQVFRVGYGYKF